MATPKKKRASSSWAHESNKSSSGSPLLAAPTPSPPRAPLSSIRETALIWNNNNSLVMDAPPPQFSKASFAAQGNFPHLENYSSGPVTPEKKANSCAALSDGSSKKKKKTKKDEDEQEVKLVSPRNDACPALQDSVFHLTPPKPCPSDTTLKPVSRSLKYSNTGNFVRATTSSTTIAQKATPESYLEQQFDLEANPVFWKDHNVQVMLRLRPLSSSETGAQGYGRCLRQTTPHSLMWIGSPDTLFTFDHVASESVTQEELFKVAGLPMVDNCLLGYNSCMFAYGQTGSGKTHTMLGNVDCLEYNPSDNRGMTPRVFEYLFQRIKMEEADRQHENLRFACKCSFLEIYNEQITDLLEPSSTNLQLREDAKKGVYVENLSEVEVTNVQDVIHLLLQGAANRKVAATNMNKESSRSHSVFTCVIESKWENSSVTNIRFGRLNLVDLAGSERQKASGAEGERLKEAANINRSLSTLGLVIMVLVDIANGKQRHVPYRDSKLTFLLQDSLGGNSKTIIIATVSPSIGCSLETLSTLKFAQRAKSIQNNAIINEDASGDVIALRQQVQKLKGELNQLKCQAVQNILRKEEKSQGKHSAELMEQLRRLKVCCQTGDRDHMLEEIEQLREKVVDLVNEGYQCALEFSQSEELAAAHRRNELLEIDVDKYQKQVQHCESNLKTYLEENENIRRVSHQFRAQSEHLQSQCSRLEEELQFYKSERVLELELQLQRSQRNLADLEVEFEKTKDKLAVAETEILHGNKFSIIQGDAPPTTSKSVEASLDLTRSQEAVFSSAVDKLDNVLNEHVSELEAKHADVLTQLQMQLETLQHALESEQLRRQVAEEQHMPLHKELDEALSKLREERMIIEALESQQLYSIKQFEDLNEEHRNTCDSLITFQQKEKILRKKLKLVHREWKKKEQELRVLGNTTKELQELKELNSCLQNEESSRKAIEHEMDTNRSVAEMETAKVITGLQEELTALKNGSLNENEIIFKLPEELENSEQRARQFEEGDIALEQATRELKSIIEALSQQNTNMDFSPGELLQKYLQHAYEKATETESKMKALVANLMDSMHTQAQTEISSLNNISDEKEAVIQSLREELEKAEARFEEPEQACQSMFLQQEYERWNEEVDNSEEFVMGTKHFNMDSLNLGGEKIEENNRELQLQDLAKAQSLPEKKVVDGFGLERRSSEDENMGLKNQADIAANELLKKQERIEVLLEELARAHGNLREAQEKLDEITLLIEDVDAVFCSDYKEEPRSMAIILKSAIGEKDNEIRALRSQNQVLQEEMKMLEEKLNIRLSEEQTELLNSVKDSEAAHAQVLTLKLALEGAEESVKVLTEENETLKALVPSFSSEIWSRSGWGRWSKELEEAKVELALLYEKMELKDSTISSVRREMEAALEGIKEAQLEMDKCYTENKTLKHAEEQARRQLEWVDSKLRNVQLESSEKQQRIDTMELEIMNSKKESATVFHELVDLIHSTERAAALVMTEMQEEMTSALADIESLKIESSNLLKGLRDTYEAFKSMLRAPEPEKQRETARILEQSVDTIDRDVLSTLSYMDSEVADMLQELKNYRTESAGLFGHLRSVCQELKDSKCVENASCQTERITAQAEKLLVRNQSLLEELRMKDEMVEVSKEHAIGVQAERDQLSKELMELRKKTATLERSTTEELHEIEASPRVIESELENLKHDNAISEEVGSSRLELEQYRLKVQQLEKGIEDKNAEMMNCKFRMTQVAEAAQQEVTGYLQKINALESTLESVKAEIPERREPAYQGPSTTFEFDELHANRSRVTELEAIVASRQKEIFILNARLAEAESMTHDVIRDLLGVKLDITNCTTLFTQQQRDQIAASATANVEDEELRSLRMELDKFILERESWLEEINRRQAEMVTARVAAEKLRVRDQALTAENEKMKAEIESQNKRLSELKEEVRTLSGQQNLQQRIHHHEKIKGENNALRVQNEDLIAKLKRTEVLLARVSEELGRYRTSEGKSPVLNIDEEERLRTKLKEVEEERIQMAQKLVGLCTSIMQAAGVSRPGEDSDIDSGFEALRQLEDRLKVAEQELSELKLKERIAGERRRLDELRMNCSPSPLKQAPATSAEVPFYFR